MSSFFEKKHRLPPESYIGRKAVVFTTCVQGRTPVLNNSELVEALLPHLARETKAQACVVPVYCFMPDHLHTVIQGTEPYSDTKVAMDRFKQQMGYWLRRNRPEVSLQRNYYDHIVRTSDDWGSQLGYVYNNPVRAGLVAHASEYPFSGSIGVDLIEIFQDASSTK